MIGAQNTSTIFIGSDVQHFRGIEEVSILIRKFVKETRLFDNHLESLRKYLMNTILPAIKEKNVIARIRADFR